MTAEEFYIGYLEETLGVPTFAERPEYPPEEWVRIEQTGGGERDHIATAVLAVQSYAPTRYRASALNQRVIAAMQNSIGRPEISRCALNSNYPFDDTTRKEHRYQAVFDLVVLF